MRKHKRKKEQMCKRDYIICTCMMTFVSGVLFYVVLYKSVYEVTSICSSNIMCWCLFIFVTTGMFLTKGNDRYYINIFVSMILGTGTYTMLMFWYSREYSMVGFITFTLIIIVSMTNSTAVVLVNRKRVSTGRIIKASMLGNRRLSAIILAGLLLFSPLYIFLGRTIIEPKIKGNIQVSESHSGFAEALNESLWNEKNVEDKADAVQMIVDEVCGDLGVDDIPSVKILKMNDYTNAAYNAAKNEIKVNTKLLERMPEDVIESVSHETYHKYQHELATLYESMTKKQQKLALFNEAREYIDEFENYTSGEDDFEKYRNQALEVNARHFARIETDKLLDIIKESRHENFEIK